MKKKIKKPWSDEARARHKAGCEQYQKLRRGMKLVQELMDLARLLDVDPRSLAETLVEAGKDKLQSIANIKPQKDRLKVFKTLVHHTRPDVIPYRAYVNKRLTEIRASA